MSDVADKLREARALIERGWTRGEYCRDGRVCAMGAINRVVTGDPARWNAESERLCHVVSDAAKMKHGLGNFNDMQRSNAPVLAAFDKAIELAEAQS